MVFSVCMLWGCSFVLSSDAANLKTCDGRLWQSVGCWTPPLFATGMGDGDRDGVRGQKGGWEQREEKRGGRGRSLVNGGGR